MYFFTVWETSIVHHCAGWVCILHASVALAAIPTSEPEPSSLFFLNNVYSWLRSYAWSLSNM